MTRVVLFAGPPASGKSTLAALLAPRMRAHHTEMDTLRQRLLPDAAHTREDRKVAYRAMHLILEILVRLGHSAILDAGYSRWEDRREVERIAREGGASLYLVECTVPVDVAIARCAARRSHHAGLDLTPQRIRELVEGFPFTATGLTVDSTRPLEKCLVEVLDFVGVA